MMEKPDFDVIDQGTIVMVTPMTPAAHDWLEKHVFDGMYFGPSLAVEHRYADDLLTGISEEGLSIHSS